MPIRRTLGQRRASIGTDPPAAYRSTEPTRNISNRSRHLRRRSNPTRTPCSVRAAAPAAHHSHLRVARRILTRADRRGSVGQYDVRRHQLEALKTQ
jgi:hypothetical protein